MFLFTAMLFVKVQIAEVAIAYLFNKYEIMVLCKNENKYE